MDRKSIGQPLLALVILLSSIFGIAYGEQHDFQQGKITYAWENEPNRFESRNAYLDAFIKCYSQVPLDVLRTLSREEMVDWLDKSFEETYADYKGSKSKLWLSAKVDGRIIGFLVIDIEKYPEEIYLSQLAIIPAYQRQGIASSMVHSLFDQFVQCKRLVVITRFANEEAIGLYNALGFKPSSYIHEGYSKELYTGFEYINPYKAD